LYATSLHFVLMKWTQDHCR